LFKNVVSTGIWDLPPLQSLRIDGDNDENHNTCDKRDLQQPSSQRSNGPDTNKPTSTTNRHKPSANTNMIDLSNKELLWDIYNVNPYGLVFGGGDNRTQNKPTDRPPPEKQSTLTRPPSSKTYSIKSLGKTYSALEGVRRVKTKRVVLSNINADKPFDDVNNLITEYAHEQNVRVTYARLLRKRSHYDGTETYTVQVNMSCDDYERVLNDKDFWPPDINCRDYIPRHRQREQQERNGQYEDEYNNGY